MEGLKVVEPELDDVVSEDERLVGALQECARRLARIWGALVVIAGALGVIGVLLAIVVWR